MFQKSKLRQSLPPNAFGLLPEMLFSEGRQRCDVTNGYPTRHRTFRQFYDNVGEGENEEDDNNLSTYHHVTLPIT